MKRLLLLLFLPFQSWALNIEVDVGVASEYSDNILLEPVVPGVETTDENIHSANINLSVDELTSKIDMQLDLTLNYLDYENNILNDEYRNTLSTSIRWVIRPQQYYWNLIDRYRQITINSQEPLSDINSQDVNEIITGPLFRWQVGRGSWLELEIESQNYYYEESLFDNNRLSGRVAYTRQVSPAINLGMHYELLLVEYSDENLSGEDNQQNNLFVDFRYSRALNELVINAGYTEIERENEFAVSTSSTLISYNRQVSRTSSFALRYRDMLTDRSASVIDNDLTALSTLFYETESSLTMSRAIGSYDWDLVFSEIEREDTATSDSESLTNILLSVTTGLSARSQIELSTSDRNSEITLVSQSPINEDVLEHRFQYRYLMSRRATLTFDLSQVVRDSEDDNRDFEDNRIMLALAYRL